MSWRVVRLQSEPASNSEQARYLGPKCQFLWEEHYGRRRYLDAKRDPWKWQTTSQQEPEKAQLNRFQREWLKVYTDRINPGRFHVWIIVDPALSKGARADRTSIMALAGLRQQRLAIVDWVLDRLNPDERIRALIKMADKWESDAILYEEVGMVADTFYIERFIDAYGINCPIIPVGRGGARHMVSKDTRIAGLVPDFREGRIVLPGVTTPQGPLPRFMYKQVDGQVVDLMAYAIESEYVRWAGEKSLAHDEFLDTLSRIHDPEFQLQYAEDHVPDTDEEAEREETARRRELGEGQWDREPGSGSWFSRL
jgi:hypothetical protein